MKLSEAILLGSTLRPQIKGHLFGDVPQSWIARTAGVSRSIPAISAQAVTRVS